METFRIGSIINKFNELTHRPVKFLSVQNEVKSDIKNLVKSIYDFTKTQEQDVKKIKNSALPELIVDDFDEEQIWQEIELQNSECWDRLVWNVANLMSSNNDFTFPIEISESKVNAPIQEEADDESIEEGHLDSDVEDESKPKSRKPKAEKSKIKKSIVDDNFFKLQEMEKFLINEEKKGDRKVDSDSEESIDMFEEVEEDSEEDGGEKDVMYSDFFDDKDHDDGYSGDIDMGDLQKSENTDRKRTKKGKKVTFVDASSEKINGSDSDSEKSAVETLNNSSISKDDVKKSEFELRQLRLQQTIGKLEEKLLTDAPWQLKGEVDATKRPQNSLLQEVIDFDLTTRPPPIITEQTTLSLEDIIRQRIKDKAWDDVVRKEKPVDDQLTFRKPEILDHAKSKQSLAQVYEAEYLKQKQALSGDLEEEKEPESHTEIRNMMKDLFSKLDALCHYHFTPKVPQAELKIVSNTPAISMEEVAPVATSDATLLAPEEIKSKRKGELISKEERTQTDKNRERRKKKKLQRLKGQKAGVTQQRNTKKGVEASDKSLKTSKAFFQQLNDNTTSLIKRNKGAKMNKG